MREEKMAGGNLVWMFTQRRCHHCIDPACVKNCPAEPKALSRDAHGIVKIAPGLCIGCGTCGDTCPFEVPTVSERYRIARKCTMCADRQSKGDLPACVKACPTGAISFGEREDLIETGRRRAGEFERGHLYGEKEGGGSAILHVLPYGIEFAGFPERPGARARGGVQRRLRKSGTARAALPTRVGGAVQLLFGLFAGGLTRFAERKQKVSEIGKSGTATELRRQIVLNQ
jgi:Fe-S-cluster-containing dehydrogenase component